MTKTAQFRIETLEKRDVPRAIGSLVSGGPGETAIMKDFHEYMEANEPEGTFGRGVGQA
jgi:hypothetical protein